MKIEKLYCLFIWLFILQPGTCQLFRISGLIKDFSSNEKLINASIYDSVSNHGSISDNSGYYSILVSKSARLTYSFVGYSVVHINISLLKDTVIDIQLQPSTVSLDEVTVTDQRIRDKLKINQISYLNLPVQTIKQMPALLGETDVLKSLQMLPGIQQGTEGSSALYVRGGGQDQNLILVDGTNVYNPYHFLGFFSFMNSDAINNVSVIKGGFPVWYGGKVSSVVDIVMKDGNSKKFHGSINAGVISSKFMFEGPLVKNKASFIMTFRRSMTDLISKAINKKVIDYYFYDASLKLSYNITPRNKVQWSFFMGKDDVGGQSIFDELTINNQSFTEDFSHKFGWANIASSLTWNFFPGNNITMKTQLNYSKYNYTDFYKFEFNRIITDSTINTSKIEKGNYQFNHLSGLNDIGLSHQISIYKYTKHLIKGGFSFNYHENNPDFNGLINKVSGRKMVNDTIIGDYSIRSHDYSIFLADENSLTKKIHSTIGLNHNGYFVQNRSYFALEPRITINYAFSEKASFKLAYSVMHQYVQLLSSSNLILPTDLWVPVTKLIKPVKSSQLAGGLTLKPFRNDILFNFEVYYKNYSNLIEYKEGTSLIGYFIDLEDKIDVGTGKSYGSEVLIEKMNGKTTGWIAYTLSWSYRQFESINQGRTYPYKFDRRHNISIVLQHWINEKININLNWVYTTGNALTLCYERFPGKQNSFLNPDFKFNGMFLTDEEILFYNQKNSYRMPSYHRLDLGLNWYMFSGKYHKLSVGAYNAYNRMNAFTLLGSSGSPYLKKITLFPILPYISYTFKF